MRRQKTITVICTDKITHTEQNGWLCKDRTCICWQIAMDLLESATRELEQHVDAIALDEQRSAERWMSHHDQLPEYHVQDEVPVEYPSDAEIDQMAAAYYEDQERKVRP